MLPLLSLLVTSNHCSSRSGCGACAQPVSSGQAPCFYCYDSDSCEQVSSNILNPLGSCKNFTFAADDCQCEPKTRTTCGKCAEIAHLGCVWATMSTNLTLGLDSHTGSLHVGTRQACTVGNGIMGPTTQILNASWTVLRQDAFIAIVSEASSFYWGQCEIAGWGFTIIVIVLVLIALVFVCGVLKCMQTVMCARSRTSVQLLDGQSAGNNPFNRGANDDKL